MTHGPGVRLVISAESTEFLVGFVVLDSGGTEQRVQGRMQVHFWEGEFVDGLNERLADPVTGRCIRGQLGSGVSQAFLS